ncbi:unnamed protein product [Rotaria sp. Silwood2]|nr:unnamed protein product [Rotaria sp. Silwood2]
MSASTKRLIRLVEGHAGDANSYMEAQNLIAQGADILARTKNGYMIDSVIAEENRNHLVKSIKAQNCQHLAKVLKSRASDLLRESVLTPNGGDLRVIELLIRLGGNCYQEQYEPLGLLGEMLKQDRVPIRYDVVKFLLNNDQYIRLCLTKADTQQRTCLSLAKNNPNCSDAVVDCLQQHFNILLNQVPFSTSVIDVNEVIEWIRRGADIKATDERGNTVLSNAVLANNLELVRALIESGCDTAWKNHDQLTSLQIAQNATPTNPRLVTMLAEQSLNTALKRLIEKKKSNLRLEEIHTLLEKGANINSLFPNKNTLLHLLIINQGTSEVLTAFVNKFHADITMTNINGYRPIEMCILHDKNPFALISTILKLPKMQTDTFFNSTLNKSILKFSIEQNRPEAANMIQHELNVRLWNCISRTNTDDNHNESILTEAAKLIQYGALIDHKHSTDDYKEWTVLHLACKIATRRFVENLIQPLKANYTIPNMNGDYPISTAAEYGQLSIVEYLRGLINIKLNVSNRNKETPLHLATKNHHLLVVRYLVLWGADYQAQNSSRETPLDIARTNVAKTKEEETNDRKLVSFFQRLICPIDDQRSQDRLCSTKPTHDLDTCELVTQVFVDQIQITDASDYDHLGDTRKSIFNRTPNEHLHYAAKKGDIELMKKVIGNGADIRCRKHNRTAYEVAKMSANESHQKLASSSIKFDDRQRLQTVMNGCQQIMDELSRVATVKLIESIQQSHSGRFLAYHLAGASVTPDLVNLACSSSNNIEIVHYLINQGADFFRMTFEYTTSDSPYYVAKKKNFHKVANYLKYLLSKECTEAIKNNKLAYVKQLVRAGASVDMIDTNNLSEALKHQNLALIEFLCENGIKMSEEWLASRTIVLPITVSEKMDPKIVFCINRCLINRRLRWAGASGELQTVIQCQRLAADINSKNCHGSTALLCTIQHGNYFRIVYTLVSCGATILHSNPNESISLIELAKNRNYEHIVNYLREEVNNQFMTAILDNNTQSATAFASLRADFNYQDEQKRTPLHYAIQYHGIDLVQWLCDRGSTPTKADINGDFPITLAVEKEPHYKELGKSIPSKAGTMSGLNLEKRYEQILLGLLRGLGEIIAESAVPLDPDDPNTYKDLFSDLTSNIRKRSSELQHVQSEKDIHTLIQQDMASIEQKLEKITNNLNKLTDDKIALMKQIEEANEQLKQRSLPARQLKDIFKNRETLEKQLANYECSMFLYQREQEAMFNQRNILKFIKKDDTLYLFYRTVDNHLQTLFTGVLAAQSGLLVSEKTTGYGKARVVVNAVPDALIPLSQIIIKPTKAILSGILSKLDEKKQKLERYNILTYGSVEELRRAASEAAGLVTLYYKEQIQSIDTFRKIEGSNVFNDKIQWIKDVFIAVRPEKPEEIPVIIVAEYVVAWMIDGLKSGKPNRTEPLAQQLWLLVAKKNPVDQGKGKAISDVVGASVGRLMIPVKRTADKNEDIAVQLRHFIGCVSVLGNDGDVYQYKVEKKNESIPYMKDLKIFGYVYVAPFSNDNNVLQSIIESRQVVPALKNEYGDILTNFDDILQVLATHQDSNSITQSAVTREKALQIAEVLREEKLFVDPMIVKSELEDARYDMECSIDILREDIQQTTDRYQTSIDAIHEQVIYESEQSREMLKKDNENRYKEKSKKLNEQLNGVQTHLKTYIEQRMEEIEKQMQDKYEKMMLIVQAAKAESSQALEQANQAVQYGEMSVKRATQAIEHAKKQIELTEQQQQKLQETAEKCENDVQRVILHQTQYCEKNILEVSAKVHNDMEYAKQWVEQSAKKANDAAQAARESASSAKDSLKVAKEQIDIQQQKSERILAEAKEIRKQGDQGVRMVQDAKKHAR